MTIRNARSADFNHLETFVWQAIFPAFDVDGLADEQRTENDQMVETARTEVISALDREQFGVFVAIDPKSRSLVGYVIADGRARSYAEITTLIVKRTYWGKGVAGKLVDAALDHIGRHRPVSIAVRHYNERAKAFFAKYDFFDTGEMAGEFAIPRTLMLREAEDVPVVPTKAADTGATSSATEPLSSGEDNFPTAADEPVYEALPNYNLAAEETAFSSLPDYNLTTDEAPLFSSGDNALTTAEPGTPLFEETNLDTDTLNELEAFIARAKARKEGKPVGPPPVVKLKPARPVSSVPVASARAAVDALAEKMVTEGQRPALPQEDNPAPTVGAEAAPEKPAGEPSFEFGFEDVRRENSKTDKKQGGDPVKAGSEIEFEIVDTTAPKAGAPNPAAQPTPVTEKVRDTKEPDGAKAMDTSPCPNCNTSLPRSARFCFNCGTPQQTEAETNAIIITHPDPTDLNTDDPTPLRLTDLPKADMSDGPAGEQEPTDKKTEKTPPPRFTTAGLKQDFRNLLTRKVTNYFGVKAVPRYVSKLEMDAEFQQVRDSSLASLNKWLQTSPETPLVADRITNVQADLVEFFLVEAARDLHRGVFPQKLLRYQSADWDKVDIFRMTMDYLDFENESDLVYTDFVTMPARALKNATETFLTAARDERILFICDQSLVSQAKNGFSMTDSAIYWKNIFQPPGQVVYKLMKEPSVDGGHLILDKQYFDAGATLNLKIALLLDKLRRRG